MTTEIEYKGFWKTPEDNDWMISGILKLSENGVILTTIGVLHKKYTEHENIPVLLGKTEAGHVTLFDCSLVFLRYGNINHEVLKAQYCIIGEIFNKIEDAKFSTVSFRFQHIESWAGIHGFVSNFYPVKKNIRQRKYIIDYKQPNEIQLYKDETKKIVLYFSVRQSFAGKHNHKAELTEKIFYNIILKKELSLLDLMDKIYSLKTFHTLAISNPSKICEINFFNKSNDLGLKFYSHEILKAESDSNVFDSSMAIPLNLIKETSQTIYSLWFNKSDILSPVYQLYYNTVYSNERYWRTDFLNLIFALETMHRRLNTALLIDTASYENILNKIKGVLSKKESELIIPRMAYLNHYSLRKRLNEISLEFDFLFTQFSEKRKDFIEKVINTRNYYVHFDESLKDKAIQEKKLPYFNHILKSLLEIYLMKELGISKDNLSLYAKRRKSGFHFL